VKPSVDRIARGRNPGVDRVGVHWPRDPRLEEDNMIATQPSHRAPTVVCELSVSQAAEATLEYASSYCKARGAQLVVVRVVEPESLRATPLSGGGGPGTWGLVGAEALLREAVRMHGLDARVVVRIGERGRVLEEECRALGAERLITAADVPPDRCPACGALYDARAVHFCPRVHLDRREPDHIEPSAA
jgi:hypothetical protein